MKRWHCKNCDSTAIDVKMWLSIQKLPDNKFVQVTDIQIGMVESDEIYCNNCTLMGQGIILKDDEGNIFENLDTKEL